MNKQDKIKTGLSSIKLSKISYDGKVNYPHFLSPIDIKNILSCLHSRGVVVKVERELPQNPYVDSYQGNDPEAQSVNDAAEWSYEEAQKGMKEAGYEAVESLIAD